MLNYAGEAGDGNTDAFTAGGATKMTRAVR